MKIPEGRNLYTTNKDRMCHVEEMIDWDTLGKERGIDKGAYNEFLSTTIGDVTGKRILPRSAATERSDYRIEDGRLVWPEEIKRSYEDLKENGLLCTGISEEYGALGLPCILTTML